MQKFFLAAVATTFLMASPALAVVGNVALSANGASFVSGTSFINLAGYSEPVAQANIITNTPSPAYFNGDTRYIFSETAGPQSLIIDLGASYSIDSFASRHFATDRTPAGLSVSVSTDGIIYTPVAGSFSSGGALDNFTYTLTTVSPVSAKFVQYDFGNGSGKATYQVYANAVPEAATWAMLITGFGMVGVAARRRKAAVAA